jgi:branched-chain amino acid transport system ATP-binding protein
MSALLSLSDVHVAYGKVEAVRGVSLDLPKGQIVTVIGANGAGKTTLLNAVMGLLPMRGKAELDGTPLGPLEVEDRVELGLCLVPERRELFGDMSVEDNLLLGGYLAPNREAVREGFTQAYALFPRLAERRRQHAGDLSGGERQMLALARALMSRPRVLLLDEPSLGLAPLIVREIFRIILDLRQQGVSILLIEQNARAALESADYAYVMENGAIVHQGEARMLINDPRVQETYLGGG